MEAADRYAALLRKVEHAEGLQNLCEVQQGHNFMLCPGVLSGSVVCTLCGKRMDFQEAFNRWPERVGPLKAGMPEVVEE